MLQVGESAPPFQLSPVFGLPVASQGLRRSLVVAFRRGLSARGVAPLLDAWPALDRDGFGLVLVTDVTLGTARDRIPRWLLRFPVVLDPDRFDAWGIPRWPRLTVVVLGPDLGVRYAGGFDEGRVLTACR